MKSTTNKGQILKEWFLRFLLMIVSIFIVLILAEIIVRIFFPISDGRNNVTLDGKPITDWFEPNSVYRQISNEYDAVTTITDKGHRVPGVEGNPEVVFIGDSFTYGFGLADDETFASIYSKKLNRDCVNLGIPGSGTLKQVDRLEQFINKWKWKPREVKLFFFGMSGSFSAGNDFVDNYNRYIWEKKVEARSDENKIEQDEQSRTNVGFVEQIIFMQEFILNHSMLMRLIKYYWGPMLKSIFIAEFGNARMSIALTATKEALKRLDDLSIQVGFEYKIYLIVPVQDIIRKTYGETIENLNKISPKSAIGTAQLLLDFPEKYYYAFDGHLNVEGNKRIAEFLIANDQ